MISTQAKLNLTGTGVYRGKAEFGKNTAYPNFNRFHRFNQYSTFVQVDTVCRFFLNMVIPMPTLTLARKRLILYFSLAIFFCSFPVFASANTAARQVLDFELVTMHYGLLNGEPMTYAENSGFVDFYLNQTAKKGQTYLSLNDGYLLHSSELIVYQAVSGDFYLAQVKAVSGNRVLLENPLEANIEDGNHVWNFYRDDSHPNYAGYKAIGDYAIKHLGNSELRGKVHAFIGDSWFDNETLVAHIANRLDAADIINKSVGGRTSADVLHYFSRDLPSSLQPKPDYVWVILGTNDYWNKMPADEYLDNLKAIILNINKLGAKAIVFTPSVAPVVYDSSIGASSSFYTQLSHQYADGLLALYEESSNKYELKANTDSIHLEAGNTAVINALANDKGSGLKIYDVNNPAHGSVFISNNRLVYEADAEFSGTDSFKYQIMDSNGDTAWGNIIAIIKSKKKTKETSKSGSIDILFLLLVLLRIRARYLKNQ